MTASELLSFNEQYKVDPYSLKVGDELSVVPPEPPQKKSPLLRGFAPKKPGIYNAIANSYYQYTDSVLEGSSVMPMNSKRHGSDEIAIVNVKDVTPQKVFAKSCQRPYGCIDTGTEPEPISNFGSWALFTTQTESESTAATQHPEPDSGFNPLSFLIGQAHANPAAIAATSIQMTQSQITLTGSAGIAGSTGSSTILKSPFINKYSLFTVLGLFLSLFVFKRWISDDDTQLTAEELLELGRVRSRIRVKITEPTHPNGYPSVTAFHTTDNYYIPVTKVDRDEYGVYSVTLEEGQQGPTIFVHPTPEDVPDWNATPGQDSDINLETILVTPVHEDDPWIETYPEEDKPHWRDTILVFPEDSGVPPLYVVYQLRGSDGRFISSGEPKPTLSRPSLREETKRQIEAATQKDAYGNFTDEEGNILTNWHYGHKFGLENRRVLRAAEELGMTQPELNDFMNSRPDYYQIEEKYINLSHKNEKPGIDI